MNRYMGGGAAAGAGALAVTGSGWTVAGVVLGVGLLLTGGAIVAFAAAWRRRRADRQASGI